MSCEAGFQKVSDATYHEIKFISGGGSKPGKLYVIYDDSTYQAAYTSGFVPNGFAPVDFAKYSVLVVKVTMNPGTGALSQGLLCVNANHDSWRYQVEYSLEGQCAGSHTWNADLYAIMVCPKLPLNADVKFSVVDINPF